MNVIQLRVAILRRAVTKLTVIAAARAASAPRFRPLGEAEAEAIVGDDLLATLSRSGIGGQRA